jgi:hypothetical protein
MRCLLLKVREYLSLWYSKGCARRSGGEKERAGLAAKQFKNRFIREMST